VQGLPEPAKPPPLTRRLITALLVACALVAAGCGSDDSDEEREPPKLPAGFNLQLFNCEDWNKADQPVRDYVLERLHAIAGDQITGPGVQGRGAMLTDAEATKIFNSRCADPRARGFVLYKIYAFARGFRGEQPGT
jgi:hypothetical protein